MTSFDESRHARDRTGKFAAHAGAPQEGHLSCDAHLDDTELDGVPGAGTWTVEGKRAVLDALGPGDPLTPDGKRMLGVLLDAGNYDDWRFTDCSPAGIAAEEYEDFGPDDIGDFRRLVNVLSTCRERTHPDGPALITEGDRGDGDVVDGYTTYVYCAAVDAHLSKWHEARELSTAGGGLRGAVHAAARIDADWHATAEKARQAGLLSQAEGSQPDKPADRA